MFNRTLQGRWTMLARQDTSDFGQDVQEDRTRETSVYIIVYN
jgi:hypothetical protein